MVETCNFYEDVEEREPDASEKMSERTGDLNSGNRSGDLNEDLEPIDYSTHGKRTQGNLIMKINILRSSHFEVFSFKGIFNVH